MKITKIYIKDFHQFNDFTLDLTYPKGHEKEGMPLDKVCFIGQSGTGKTSLLELIPKNLFAYNTNLISKSGIESIFNNIKISCSFGINNEYSTVTEYTKNTAKTKEGNETSWIWGSPKLNNKPCTWESLIDYYENEWINKTASKLIYFPANLNYNLDFDSSIVIDNKDIIDFSVDRVAAVWNLILDKIQNYQEKEISIRQKISKTVEESSNDLEIIQKALKELEDWKKSEFNPIQDVAQKCLDPLLRNFKLKVKTELVFKTKDDIGFIKIQDFNNNEIPHSLWSTGTKQVVLSALPLYLLKPKNTIILFDEPERSLYPDLQRLIVDYYSSLTENCQFFYSTHSPIIASSFEPWEIVELKFNQEGKIYRELYYEGKNHVDNYKWNPQYMRWDDILQRVFDLKNDGSETRQIKLDELATLNVKYKKLKKLNKEESDEGISLSKEIAKLSLELSKWD